MTVEGGADVRECAVDQPRLACMVVCSAPVAVRSQIPRFDLVQLERSLFPARTHAH